MIYAAQGIKTYLGRNAPLQQKGGQCSVYEQNLFFFFNFIIISKLKGTSSNSIQVCVTLTQYQFK